MYSKLIDDDKDNGNRISFERNRDYCLGEREGLAGGQGCRSGKRERRAGGGRSFRTGNFCLWEAAESDSTSLLSASELACRILNGALVAAGVAEMDRRVAINESSDESDD